MTLIGICNNKKTPQLQLYDYQVNINNTTLVMFLVHLIKPNWTDLTTGTEYKRKKLL